MRCRLCVPSPQCHKAKNLLPNKGAQATQTAKAVVEIQVGAVVNTPRFKKGWLLLVQMLAIR